MATESELYYCCSLNMKCPTGILVYVWSPAGSAILKDCEAFMVWCLAEGGLEFYSLAALPVHSLLPDCRCHVTSHLRHLLPCLPCHDRLR